MINEITRDVLQDYFRIIEQDIPASYLQTKFVPVKFSKEDSLQDLWKKHDHAINQKQLKEVIPEQSLLDLKKEIADRIFKDCIFCENRCQVNRNLKHGKCQVKKATVASEFPHMGEETVLVPSHTIFFSGCTFKCVFCQNWNISQEIKGLHLSPSEIAEKIEHRYKQGTKNVNWVGGDPTPNIPYILATLQRTDVNTPQIWNSNMYCSIETMKLLNHVIDVYLTDFKYGNDSCAQRLSGVNNYTKIIKRNHKIASVNGEVIIRHLVLPNHIECCSKPIIKWIADNIPNVLLNIMAQYHPDYKAFQYDDIAKSVSLHDVEQVRNYAEKLGLFQI